VKCSNCDNEAIYVYQTASTKAVHYCASCLPSFLRGAAKTGALNIPEAHEQVTEEVVATLSPEAVTKPRKRRKPVDWVDPAVVVEPEEE
jgi:hypothetical protein